MSIQGALYTYLVNNTAVSALVSSRVYPAGNVPTSASMPYITYQRIDNVHERHMEGSAGLAHPRYQLNIVADTELEAHGVVEAVRGALDSFRGELGEGSNMATVRGAFLEDDRDLPQTPTDATEAGPHGVAMDFIIWHTE